MLEELSLSTNRGSQLFQQRQKRMQRFVFEHPSGYRKVCARLCMGWCPPPLAAFAGDGSVGWLCRVVQHPTHSKGMAAQP